MPQPILGPGVNIPVKHQRPAEFSLPASSFPRLLSAGTFPGMRAFYFWPAVCAVTVSITVTGIVGVTWSLERIVTCFIMRPDLPAVSTETFNCAVAPGSSRSELTSPAVHPQVGCICVISRSSSPVFLISKICSA